MGFAPIASVAIPVTAAGFRAIRSTWHRAELWAAPTFPRRWRSVRSQDRHWLWP